MKFISFYLPQYHPIPENNQWWGMGFTEWTNVTQTRPLFPNHYQPHFPADLGFYDLRLGEARQAQVDLAQAYGIHGFCYYHYWFQGKRLLERPFHEVLASGEPDFPFCLCWANESWSRRWLGEEKAILQAQTYSLEDDRAHGQWLVQAFADPRYIRIQGRPLFLIYRPRDLPAPQKTIEILRNTSIHQGLPNPYLLGVDAHCRNLDCRTLGFDGTLQFEPQLGVLPDFIDDRPRLSKLKRNLKLGILNPQLKVYDYPEARQRMMAKKSKDFPSYPCIFVGWDNTPRRGKNGIIMVNSTPEHFEQGLSTMVQETVQETLQETLEQMDQEPLIFINAWNEWAEGNHLEPDLQQGHAYLEVVQRVMNQSNAFHR
jgi:hypothetical protein